MVKVGEVPNTITPVPVSSETEAAKFAEVMVFVSTPPAPVKTPRFAVRPEKVTVPEEIAVKARASIQRMLAIKI